MMKIALAQIRVLPGQPERNFQNMVLQIKRAKEVGCSVISFPEMCISGYLLGDLWTDDGWCRDLVFYNEELRKLSQDILLLYGNLHWDPSLPNKDGRIRKYNAGFAFHNMKPVQHKSPLPPGVTVKTLLPQYRIFDDARHFFSLLDLANELGYPVTDLLHPFETVLDGSSYRFGLEICEDLWFKDYRYAGQPLNVTKVLVQNGAEQIFNLSASPWTYGKNAARDRRICEALEDCGKNVPFYYVNCTGVQNNGKNIVTFDGDSTVYGRNSEIVQAARGLFEEELVIHDTRMREKEIRKKELSKVEVKTRACLEGIRGFDEIMGQTGFPFVIGISGGVDSALATSLLVLAAGKERVKAFNLPSQHNSPMTIASAENTAKKLGLKLSSLPIGKIVDAHLDMLGSFQLSILNRENIQAKVRGTSLLSNIAGILGGVMTNNGNKVEMALGYATLYGDVNGGLAPIGDLLKTEVFAMADYINREIFREEVIPQDLLPNLQMDFNIPPTAELKPDQRDPMKWGYHDALLEHVMTYRRKSPEDFLSAYLEGSLATMLEIDPKLLEKYGLHNPAQFVEDLEWFFGCFRRGVFKRIQSPPVIILSRSSFGYDFRESQVPHYQTRKYLELRKRILKL